MCLNEMYSKVHIGKHLSDSFLILNGLKHGNALSPLLFNFTLEYIITKVKESQVGLRLDVTHQLLVYAYDVNLLGDNIDTMKKNIETFNYVSKKAGLEVDAEETENMLLSHRKNAGQIS
jgi:hypothetical protein